MASLEMINIEACLDSLRSLSFTRDVIVEQYAFRIKGTSLVADALIKISTPTKTFRFPAEYKAVISHAIIYRFIDACGEGRKAAHLLFCAPYISSQMAQFLDERDINFADLEGNCRLSLGDRYYALVTGRKRRIGRATPNGIRAAGYQVIFALLADASLVDATVRDISGQSGVGKSTVSNWLRQLEDEGFIGKTKSGLQIIRRSELMDRWLEGYKSVVEPKIVLGTFQTPENNPDKREKAIDRILADFPHDWTWGGLSAAWRLVRYYRGKTTTLHADRLPSRFLAEAKALPASDGHLIIMKSIGQITYNGVKPHTVHPLLAYTQLITSSDDRARETAMEMESRGLTG